MNDSKDYIEKELMRLAEKIYDDFNTKSYSAKLYSKILNNIISTFIEMRLHIFFLKLEMTTNIKLKEYNFDSMVNQLYHQLYHGKRIALQNDFELENILLKLIPSSSDIIYSTKYGNGEYSLKNLIQHIESNGIQMSRTDLIKYDHKRNCYRLSNKLFKKYKFLFNILLTVYLSLKKSKIDCSDLPKRINNAIRFQNRTKNIDIINTNFQVESLILKQLRKTLNKGEGLIKSLYRFPDRKQEIQNLKEFLRTNDLWKLDIIKPDFMLIKKGKRLDCDVDTKLKLIRKLRLDESITIEGGVMILYFEHLRYLNSHYTYEIKSKLKNAFEEWSFDPIITEWENYWFDKKHIYLQNEIIKSYNNSERNSIKRIGAGWEISYLGEKKIIKDLLGIYYFSICLNSPGTEFSYSNLMNIKYIFNSPINEDTYDLYRKRKEITNEINKCESNMVEDPTYYEVQLEKLESELKIIDVSLQKLKLVSPNANSTDKKISDAFTKACRKAKSLCLKEFPKFYEHINNYISWRNGKITYSGYLDWL